MVRGGRRDWRPCIGSGMTPSVISTAPDARPYSIVGKCPECAREIKCTGDTGDLKLMRHKGKRR